MNKASGSKQNSRRSTRKLMLASSLMLLATAAAVHAGTCYTAEVPGTIVLPDGSAHASGWLRLCTDHAISPVSSLHRGFVGGRPVGMFLSVPRVIEGGVDEGTAQFIFDRGAGNELILVGYIVSTRDKNTLFEMVRAKTTRTVEDIASIESGNRDDMVMLIASTR